MISFSEARQVASASILGGSFDATSIMCAPTNSETKGPSISDLLDRLGTKAGGYFGREAWPRGYAHDLSILLRGIERLEENETMIVLKPGPGEPPDGASAIS